MFFERPDSGERAVLVHLEMSDESEQEDRQEFKELVTSAGADPVDLLVARRSQPNPRFFVGSGKVEEIRQAVQAHEAEVVLFNHALTPTQERNLEKELKCRVLDRTGLILDIFAQRARTYEGKLQVELAQLQHMSTRLVRGWTHLERQKGGIGLRGPGETQLETDRRLLRIRLKSISRRLERVRRQRDQGRQSRKRAEIPAVSLAGYTNAGKSTLFNRLTDACVYAEDQLFATLDPTLRRLQVEGIGPVVLADTVGFIRHLPHKLVEAFRATLQETAEATLLLHVIDAADENRDSNIEEVDRVLAEIKADEVPRLLVYNKIDLLDGKAPRIDRDDQGVPWRVWVSAETGAGIELLTEAVCERLAGDMVNEELHLDAGDGRLRAKFYQLGAVVEESVSEQGDVVLKIRMPRQDYERLLAR
ncbi:MAG: ribosome rescue GTPase HflX [Pseudomonadales bacterium]